MNIEIIDRNQCVGEKLRQVTEQKLAKLDKYFGNNQAFAKVSFKKQSTSLTTEIMLEYVGKLVRATATSDNFYDNIDVILPKLEGQIRKYRTRFDQHQKNSAFKENAVYFNDQEPQKTAKIVKEKKFKLKPMTLKEAEEEMELLGHNFFVFLEVKTNTIQVLYLRNDGELGLIEPEI